MAEHHVPLRRRRPFAALAALLIALPLLVVTPATAQTGPGVASIPGAASWIAAQIDEIDDPSPGTLADAILAYAATGSAKVASDVAYAAMVDGAEAYVVGASGVSAGRAAKVVLAASVQGGDPSDLDGFDAVDALLDTLVVDGGDAGRFGTSNAPFVQSLAILALVHADGSAPASAVDWLADAACADGAWDATATCSGGSSDEVDVTALAAQALLAADADAEDAIDWLLDAQATNGSFAAFGAPSTNSTALAAQTLRVAGEDQAADAAAAYVATLQYDCEHDDAGAFPSAPDGAGDLFIATSQAVFATSPGMADLDATASSAVPASLGCYDGWFCPPGVGVTVIVDWTTLDASRLPEARCALDLPADANGFDVLASAGFEVETESFDFGDALCSIEGLPVLADGECFSDDGFYSYWNAPRRGDWTGYEVGGSDSRPAVGSVEGWSWAPAPTFTGVAPRTPTDGPSEPETPLPTPPYDRGIAAACPGSYPRAFVDIAGSPHEGAIRCLAAAEVTQGTSDPTRYAPRREVTRAQLASFLARTYEVSTGAPLPAGPDRFPDDDGSVHERNINALAAAGVIAGVGDGSRFAPGDAVTRGQMASLLARFLDLLDDGAVNRSFPPPTDLDVFPDDTGSVHADPIDRLAAQGVVQGKRDGTYGWRDAVTRDQLATFLARAVDLAVSEDLAGPIG